MPNSAIDPLASTPKRSKNGEVAVVARAASQTLQSTVGDGDCGLSYERRGNGLPVLACEVITNLFSPSHRESACQNDNLPESRSTDDTHTLQGGSEFRIESSKLG